MSQEKLSLYEITEELAKLDELLELSGGALPEGGEGVDIQAWMDKYEFMAREKVDGYGSYWANLKGAVEMYEAEIERLAAKVATAKRKQENLKILADIAMTKLKREKLEGRIFTISKQKNGGKAPVEILEPYKSDPEKLPKEFQKISVSVDKEKVREALEKEPTGAVASFAAIGKIGYSIRLK